MAPGTLAVARAAAVAWWAAQGVDAGRLSSVRVLVADLPGATLAVADGWTVTSWAREPIGGAWLDDVRAPDPTGGELDAEDAPDAPEPQSSGS